MQLLDLVCDIFPSVEIYLYPHDVFVYCYCTVYFLVSNISAEKETDEMCIFIMVHKLVSPVFFFIIIISISIIGSCFTVSRLYTVNLFIVLGLKFISLWQTFIILDYLNITIFSSVITYIWFSCFLWAAFLVLHHCHGMQMRGAPLFTSDLSKPTTLGTESFKTDTVRHDIQLFFS